VGGAITANVYKEQLQVQKSSHVNNGTLEKNPLAHVRVQNVTIDQQIIAHSLQTVTIVPSMLTVPRFLVVGVIRHHHVWKERTKVHQTIIVRIGCGTRAKLQVSLHNVTYNRRKLKLWTSH
jgi:hypothetical protein